MYICSERLCASFAKKLLWYFCGIVLYEIICSNMHVGGSETQIRLSYEQKKISTYIWHFFCPTHFHRNRIDHGHFRNVYYSVCMLIYERCTANSTYTTSSLKNLTAINYCTKILSRRSKCSTRLYLKTFLLCIMYII